MVSYKIMKAAMELGLNYNDIPDMIEITDRVSIAAWGINKETRESKIFVNPKVAKFPIKQIQIVLRHEVLHYAGYRELGILGNKDLENVVLDITINRILSFPYPDISKKLSKRIYPLESKDTILALAQAHLKEETSWWQSCKEKDRELQDFYIEIWDSDEVPSPLSLYYRLFKLNEDKIESPWGQSGDGKENDGKDQEKKEDDSQDASGSKKPNKGKSKSKSKSKSKEKVVFHEIPAEMDTKEEKEKVKDKPLLKEAKNQISKMREDCRYKRGRSYSDSTKATEAFSNATSELFDKILVQAEDGIDAGEVSRFIESLNLQKEMIDAIEPLIREASSSSIRQVYPLKLSRLGIIYVACGISDIIPLYYNQTPESQKLSVAVYIDTSPSMDEFKENEVWLIDKLKESFPTDIFVFSGSVEKISEADVLARLRELLEHGYGRLEVEIREAQIFALNWQKSTRQIGTQKKKTQS